MSPKIRLVAARIISSIMFTWFFGGFIIFPDAPIRSCPNDRGNCVVCQIGSYYGKQGRLHTASDFYRFEIWQYGLFVLWPVGGALCFLLRRSKSPA